MPPRDPKSRLGAALHAYTQCMRPTCVVRASPRYAVMFATGAASSLNWAAAAALSAVSVTRSVSHTGVHAGADERV